MAKLPINRAGQVKMRLVCPNCDAEYEVDDAAIPRTGRDVQCSNCGHAWFQTHPEMVPEDAQDLMAPEGPDAVPEGTSGADEAAPDDAAMAVADPNLPPETVPELGPPEARLAPGMDQTETTVQTEAGTDAFPEATEPARAKVPEPAAEAAGVTRNIDESVLAVLREEAAREVAARRAETPAPALETQTEMRLAPAPNSGLNAGANAVVARLKGEPEPVAEVQPPGARPRRELLPAIDEINSTLRASSGRPGEDEASVAAAEAAQAARNRFGSGFLTLILLAVVLLALYILAPVIAEKVPALAGVMASYVAAVDAARIWLDDQIRSLIGMLRGLEGGSQG